MNNRVYMLIITLTIFISKLNAGTIYVSASGDDESGDGSSDTPYLTIQKGIDEGQFKNLDVNITAMSIMVNIEGIMWFTLFKRQNMNARDYIQTISDFILAGLTKKQQEVIS